MTAQIIILQANIYTVVTMPDTEMCKLLVYIFQNSPLLRYLVISKILKHISNNKKVESVS